MTDIDLTREGHDDFVARISLRETFRRGFAISPEIRKGIGVTIAEHHQRRLGQGGCERGVHSWRPLE